jgi:hypothetical protein
MNNLKRKNKRARRNLLERLEEKKNIQGKKLCKLKRIIRIIIIIKNLYKGVSEQKD